MPSSSSLKRKFSFSMADSTDCGSHKRVKPSQHEGREEGDNASQASRDGGSSVSALKAELEEMRARYARLEQEAHFKSEAMRRVHDHVQCSICRDVIRNPYTLECGHSACYKCLRACWTVRSNTYQSYNNEEEISTDDDSDHDEAYTQPVATSVRGLLGFSFTRPLPLHPTPRPRPSHIPPRRRFRSVTHCLKQCPECKKDITRRPVVDYRLRHVVDALRLTPLSPTAQSQRDMRWGRRRDVWRGIFPSDNGQEEQRHTQAQTQLRAQRPYTHARGRIETPSHGRTERRLAAHPYHDDIAEYPRRRWQRFDPVDDAAGRVATPILRALAPSPEEEFEPRLELIPRIEVFPPSPPPAPRLPFIDHRFSGAEVEDTRPSSPPLPRLEHLLPPQPASSSALIPSSVSPPQSEYPHSASIPESGASQSSLANILEILDILRQSSPDHVYDEEGIRENGIDDSDGPHCDKDEDEDEHLDLIHAMLHGDGSRTSAPAVSLENLAASVDPERYPVYVEELDLDSDTWIGRDLED